MRDPELANVPPLCATPTPPDRISTVPALPMVTSRAVPPALTTALPPETVLKAGERALAVAQGDPDGVHTLDLGCGESFASARVAAKAP